MLSAIIVNAFDHNTIRGKVVDVESGEVLSGAHIIAKDLDIFAISDDQGLFILSSVPMGDVYIEIHHIGYNSYQENIHFTGEEKHTFFFRLKALPFGINQVVVTATRSASNTMYIPATVDVVSAEDLANHSLSNIDDIFHSIANVQVNRSWGIYSKNTSVTMRGLESASRTLVMLNGIPLNQEAGGPVSWHLINPDEVERIEIVKGPGSAIHGSNAMGGAINIVTKLPVDKNKLSAKVFYGTYNTFGANLNLGQNLLDKQKGFYYNTDLFFRKGDGYNFNPPDYSDDTDYPLFLEEYTGKFNGGYQFNRHHKLNFTYAYHFDKRGDGKKVYEELGSYYSYTDHFMQGSYKGRMGKTDLNANLYNHREHYYRQNESLNSSDEYRLYETNSDKYDIGMLLNGTRALGKSHQLTVGLDIKQSGIDAADDYMTSSDSIAYFGTLDYLGYFIQDEIKLYNNKLIFNLGLRADHSQFRNGSLDILEPTSVTGFPQTESKQYKSNTWSELSPKMAAKYHFSGKYSMYMNVSKGFKPPKLDDLCRSGKVTKGFKLANPDLKPESLINYEIGADWLPREALHLSGAVYHSLGTDMVFFVNTGDTVDTGGSSLKPVLQKQNLSKVSILGTELSLEYQISKWFTLKTNYTHNRTQVLDFIDEATGRNHKGMELIEVSPNLFFAGLYFKHHWFKASLSYSFVDEQWVDDLNTQKVDSYDLVDFHLAKTIAKRFTIDLDVQNLLDQPYIDRKGRLSPGRFAMLSIKYML